MDDSGQFGSQGNYDDSGIETPVGVGTDERRMHVRAYNYWVSLLDGRAYPSIEDLNPEDLEDFGPKSILLDFTSGVEDPAISWLGDQLRRACDLPEGLSSVNDIPARSILSRLTDHYMQIIANRAPIGFEAEYMNDRGTEILYRGILMPFSSDDDTIDFIYGVINWKEVADGETTQLLQDEVAKMLASSPRGEDPIDTRKPSLWPEAPVARIDQSASAWADGPSGISDADIAPGFSPEALGDIADDLEPLELTVPAPLHAVEPEPSASQALVVQSAMTEADMLADWLATARVSADEAVQAHHRSRSSLYNALAAAYDFAMIAEDRPEEYAELLGDAGLDVQPRSPMTPVVKLVFGVGYDKTRLAEYAAALTHGRRAGISCGNFEPFVAGFAGGLKGVINAERSLRRVPVKEGIVDSAHVERARSLAPRGIVEISGNDEFVVLIARRVDNDHVAVIGQMEPDTKLIDKALKQIAR